MRYPGSNTLALISLFMNTLRGIVCRTGGNGFRGNVVAASGDEGVVVCVQWVCVNGCALMYTCMAFGSLPPPASNHVVKLYDRNTLCFQGHLMGESQVAVSTRDDSPP